MKTEAELWDLHARLRNALSYAKSTGIPFREVRELIAIKVQLEYVLGMNTASANHWQAAVFKSLHNLEGLKKTHERSVQAGNN